MKHKKLIFSIFSLYASAGLHAMELNPSERARESQEKIVMRCDDGQILRVSRPIALEVSCIKNCLYDAQEDTFGGIAEKESDFDNSFSLDFTQKAFYKATPEGGSGLDVQDGMLEKLDLSKNALEKLFNCIRDKRQVKKLCAEEINTVFEAADSLGAPQWLLRKLTLQGKKIVPQEKQHPKITCNHYLKSISSAHNEGLLSDVVTMAVDENDCQHCLLNFEGKNLDTLDGLKKLFIKKYNGAWITKINLKRNKLKVLDVAHLIESFPELQEINVKKNHIETLILPEQLPYGFKLNLNKNHVQHVPVFDLGENGVIKLKKNPLSKQARRVALYAGKPTLFERHRHRIKAITDDMSLFAGSVGAATGLSGIVMSLVINYIALEKIVTMNEMTIAMLKEAPYTENSEYIQNLLSDTSMMSAMLQSSKKFLTAMWDIPKIRYFCVGAPIIPAGIFMLEHYCRFGYNNNLIYKFKPGKVFLDPETKE